MDTQSVPAPLAMPIPEDASETEKNMLEAGVAIDEPAFEDYFGFEETHKWYFPDGKQYVEFQIMNDGARSRYQAKTSQNVRLFKTSGDAQIKVDPAQERGVLFEESVVGWFVVKKNPATGEFDAQPFDRGGKPQQGGNFDQWRMKANPKFITELESAIRKVNPWLRNDLSIKDIDEQMDELREMRAEAMKREEGK